VAAVRASASLSAPELVAELRTGRTAQQGPDLAQGPRRAGREQASSRLGLGGQVFIPNDPRASHVTT
jgi:hypothetical protein